MYTVHMCRSLFIVVDFFCVAIAVPGVLTLHTACLSTLLHTVTPVICHTPSHPPFAICQHPTHKSHTSHRCHAHFT